MFTNIRLGNFKSYADSGDIPLRPLTILVGPNNAGKSTLLQALLLLKQTLEDKASREALITSGPLIQMGIFNYLTRMADGFGLQLDAATERAAETGEGLWRRG